MPSRSSKSSSSGSGTSPISSKILSSVALDFGFEASDASGLDAIVLCWLLSNSVSVRFGSCSSSECVEIARGGVGQYSGESKMVSEAYEAYLGNLGRQT